MTAIFFVNSVTTNIDRWRLRMTSWHRNVFALLALCEGNPPPKGSLHKWTTFRNLVLLLSARTGRWRSMMTSPKGNIFHVTGHLCGEFTGPLWIPNTKASDAELWCFLWSASGLRLSKQSWGWWFETLSRSLWNHFCNHRHSDGVVNLP